MSVATALPFPPDDGTRIRTWNLLTRLSSKHEVTLVTWHDPDLDPGLADEVRRTFPRHVIGLSKPARGSAVSRLRRRMVGMAKGLPPYMVERLERQEIPELRGGFDVAMAEDDGALLLMPDVSCPIAVNRHNIFTETISALASSAELGLGRRLKWRSELPTWERFDRSLSEKSDMSFVTTPEAAAALSKIAPGTEIAVIPNGVDIPPTPLDVGADPVAVFIGAMNYEPNADAVTWFARSVLPLVDVPDARFKIIGRLPLPSVRRLGAKDVEVTGEVRDIRDACRGARIGVVPLRAGSGIKNKTIELMAMGLPVVATTQGCEGIDATPQDGLIRADDATGFARAVSDLMSDHSRAVQLGAAARRFAASFSWDEAARKLDTALQELALRKVPA